VIDRRGLAVFLGVTFALTWALDLGLWLGGGLGRPLAIVFLALQMLFPAIGALVTVRATRQPDARRFLGIRLGEPGWPWVLAATWVGVPVLVLSAPFVGAALGVYEMDLGMSAMREIVTEQSGAEAAEQLTPRNVAIGLVLASLFAPLLNGLFTLGEELGWRGYLVPTLRPLGDRAALVLSGVIWGVWHAPVVVMGHNYPGHPVLAPFLMVGFCVIWGVLLGWTRLRTGSVWPSVVAHASMNALAGAASFFVAAGSTPDPALAGATGVTGWILPGLLAAALLAFGRTSSTNPSSGAGAAH
jgi:membrane protease YdiL (CAAX protease family)